MSWLDGDNLDPDADGCCESMMALLTEESTDVSQSHTRQAGVTPSVPIEEQEAVTAPAIWRLLPEGHNYHFGPPFLRCIVHLGTILLHEVDPDHALLSEAETKTALDRFSRHGELTVRVDWTGMIAEACLPALIDEEVCYRLSVRRCGVELGYTSGTRGAPLHVTFNAQGVMPGTAFVAELLWPSGSRHLHVLAPPALNTILLDGLVSPAGMERPLQIESLLAPCGRPPLAPLAESGLLPDRGFGIELELLTEAPDPERSGYFNKMDEMAGVFTRITEDVAKHAQGSEDMDAGGRLRKLTALLHRCQQWSHVTDRHVNVTAETVAKRTVQTQTSLSDDDDRFVKERHRCETLLTGGNGIMKSEFKSPPPPGELNFAKGGAEELVLFERVLHYIGAGAASIAANGQGGASIHVHVNVISPMAAGDALSIRELLAVFFSWVRFDLVTSRFTRPWMWREPASPTLYATGAEYCWNETAWEQGCLPCHGSAKGDIPTFLAGVRSVMHGVGYDELPESEKREKLFGHDGTPAAGLYRYSSLNMRSIIKYGTVEVRRFHATLDAEAVQRWAHFCVCFVEVFRKAGSSLSLVDALLNPSTSISDTVALLQREQELATPEELMSLMSELLDVGTAKFFLENAVAPIG